MNIALDPLPFPADALEPYISAKTVQLHYEKHQAGYVERVNRMLKDTGLANSTLTEVVLAARDLDNQNLFNNAAQAWSHAFYWKSLSPRGGARPHGQIADLIDRDFGRYEVFIEQLRTAALAQFGSGWVWLVVDDSRLKVRTTSNADLPLIHGQTPLLVIDVWEHAYYLDFQNARGTYVSGLIHRLLNWEHANEQLEMLDAEAAPSIPASRARKSG